MNKLSESASSYTESDAKKMSVFVFISFAMGDVVVQLFIYLYGVRTFDFYENEIGLASGIISIAFVIFAIWNMVNDPIIGFLADKPRSFWRKYGKRLPWVVTGGIGTALGFILIFAIPDVDPQTDWLFTFIWLLLSVCLFDTFFSMFDTNYTAIIPDKFRSDKLRVRLASFQVSLGLFGTVLAVVISPMFIVYGQKSTFLTMSIIIGMIGIVLVLLQLYGIREDKAMVESYYQQYQKKEKPKFTSILKVVVNQKSFLGFLVLYTFYQTTISILLASIPYLVRFILDEQAIVESFILIGYIMAGLISIPIWGKLALKKGNKNIFVAGGIVIVMGTIPFLFVNNVIGAIISASIVGIGLIGFWLMLNPIISDVIDEAIANSGIRQEGLYMGVRTFFGRIAIALQAVIFGVVHILTGFTPASPIQSDFAVFGIRLQMAIIPGIIMAIGLITFWKLYDLTDEKKKMIRERLAELKI